MSSLKEQEKNWLDLLAKDKTSLSDLYVKYLHTVQEILSLLKTGGMTPEVFDKYSDRYKWDIARELKDVKWYCKHCEIFQTDEMPEGMFMGERCCSNCDGLLTKRTNGGQNDPFNYKFK